MPGTHWVGIYTLCIRYMKYPCLTYEPKKDTCRTAKKEFLIGFSFTKCYLNRCFLRCDHCLSPMPSATASIRRVALHCEYTVPTCPPLSLSFVPISSFLVLFVFLFFSLRYDFQGSPRDRFFMLGLFTAVIKNHGNPCLLYTSPSPRDS